MIKQIIWYTKIIPVMAMALPGYTLTADDSPLPSRLEVDQQANELIDLLSAKDPEFKERLASSAGYFAGELLHIQAAVLGLGSGTGVLVDNASGERSYIDVTRFDLGAGFGGQSLLAVILIEDRERLEEAKEGHWAVSWGAEAVAGEAYAASRRQGKDYSVYALTREGFLATATLRFNRFRLNPEMNNLGVSQFNIPNRPRSLGAEEKPREWNRSLPFLARKAVEQGYDLPLPYGVGPIYIYSEQEQILDRLRIGFGGSNKIAVEGIIFEKAISRTNAYQFKMDGWIFPFMNVFGAIGYMHGKGPLTLRLDGNTIIDDLGLNCGGILPNPLCKVFKDKSVTIPVTADIQGVSYTAGTLLAGGWRGWFATVPVTVTYVDLKDSVSEGYTIGLSPRGGRIIPLEKLGNLAVFVGAQYIKSDLEIDGAYTFPGTEVTVEYLVGQRNKDPWTITLGYNWEINRRWSWSVEYSGFIGSRKNIVVTAGYRY